MPGSDRGIRTKSRVSGRASGHSAGSSNRQRAAKILKKALAVRAQVAQVIREARRELKVAAVRRHFALRATCAAYLRGEVGAAAMQAALVRA